MEAHGPRMMVAMPTPTACPVVPPGSGRLNIMTTKENAANTDSNGTSRVERLASPAATRCTRTAPRLHREPRTSTG